MLHFLPGRLRGVLTFFLIVVNTFLIFIPLMTVAMVKLVLPFYGIRKILSIILIRIASVWVAVNALIFRLMHKLHWDVSGVKNLSPGSWYLVISNHQSWVDIFVIQTILLGRVPYIKFFLKKELIWVPMLGVAWWALDFPFMKRYSKAFLEKNPHLIGKDVEATRKACEKFKFSPISIMNFVEGTRFTEEKHEKQKSSYTHLLKPKAGGVAFVMGAMGEYLNNILNFTIAYPEGAPAFWDFLCGKVSEIRVDVKTMPVEKKLLGDYDNDPEYRAFFQTWVNEVWVEKDKQMDRLLNGEGDIPGI
jgi:1-acyl-sn-glycerol-3-phosphate acyltransferase